MPEPRRLARSHVSSGRARIHAPSAKLGSSPSPSSSAAGQRKRRTPRVLLVTRWFLPAAIIIAGAIAASFGSIDAIYGGTSLIAAGIAVWLISWAYRFGTKSDDERAAEASARAYFERFGRWPDGS